MLWCHWWHNWHHVIPVLTSVVLHDQMSYAAPHFDCLDLRKAMVPLMMPLASCDVDASAIGITWPKVHVAPHFSHLDLRNAIVPWWYHQHHMMLTPVPMASHDHKSHIAPHFDFLDLGNTSCDADTSTNSITWQIKSCWTSFWSSWPKECNDAINSDVCFT